MTATTVTDDAQPCEDCDQVHPKMSRTDIHILALTDVYRKVLPIVEASPGTYPDLEQAMVVAGETAKALLLERLLEGARESAPQSQAPAQPTAPAPRPLAGQVEPSEGSGFYL